MHTHRLVLILSAALFGFACAPPTEELAVTTDATTHPCPTCEGSLLEDLVYDTVDIVLKPGGDYEAFSPTSLTVECENGTASWSIGLDVPSTFDEEHLWAGEPRPDQAAAATSCLLKFEGSESFEVPLEIR
ncbi:MAG: hypothetical protein RMA76_10290 [Deltaproteobacteria bacterium]|jgi:hypothetical protein